MTHDAITIELNNNILLNDFAQMIQQFLFAYGSVKGIVEPLTIRKERKFILYDALFDRAVACYFEQDQEELVRTIWGKNVIVSGYIGRNPETGRPSIICNIRTIDFTEKPSQNGYKDARGVFTYHTDDESAEHSIRRLRDVS